MPDKTDKGDVHSYIPVYEHILAPYRTTAKNVLEIGLFNGASMKMWERYFPDAIIYGMDCDVQPHGGLADLRPMIESGGYNIAIGDATSPADLKRYFNDLKFDVIIEDAGHAISQQFEIYAALKPYLNKGAIYVIEDVQDIDRDLETFMEIDPEKNVEIVDRRSEKGRYDDVLIIITDK